jgi:hypothetical protein
LFATGCSSDEVVESASKAQKAITFENAFIDKSTRSTTAEDPSTTLDNLEKFLAYGFQADTLLFKGQSVSKDGDNWIYSPLKYWVTDAAYNFIGVANLSSDATAEADLAADKSEGAAEGSKVLTLTISDFVSDGETDLLASAQVATTGAQNHEAVALTFKHLLSKVKFTFNNNFATNDDVTLKVDNVKITNAYQTGNVVVAGTTPTITWSDQDSESLGLEFGNTDKISPASNDVAAKELLLIPSLDTKEYTVTFDVEVIANADSSKDGAGAEIITAVYSHTAKVSGVEFKAGNSYNLVASLDNTNVNEDDEINPIKFTVTAVSSWVTNSDITFPSEDTAAEEGGEEEAEVN